MMQEILGAGERAIPLDVSEVGRADTRDSIRSVIRDLGLEVDESDRFWDRAFVEKARRAPRPGTLVVADLSRIGKRFTSRRPQEWTAVVRSTDPYFLALVRTRRDQSYAWIVDDLLRASDLRLLVSRVGGSRAELTRCVADAVSARSPEALAEVVLAPDRGGLIVRFADGLMGQVEWTRLGIEEPLWQRLIPESATVGSRGGTIDILTRDGDLFEIDGAAVRAAIDSKAALRVAEWARGSDASVGDRVRSARRRAGLTQTALADRIGMDQAVISRIERGKHRPRYDTLRRLADGIGLSVPELLAA